MDPTTIFTISNICGNIWGTCLEAEDIAPLMSKLNLWSRHKFPAAAVVKTQVAAVAQKAAGNSRIDISINDRKAMYKYFASKC